MSRLAALLGALRRFLLRRRPDEPDHPRDRVVGEGDDRRVYRTFTVGARDGIEAFTDAIDLTQAELDAWDAAGKPPADVKERMDGRYRNWLRARKGKPERAERPQRLRPHVPVAKASRRVQPPGTQPRRRAGRYKPRKTIGHYPLTGQVPIRTGADSVVRRCSCGATKVGPKAETVAWFDRHMRGMPEPKGPGRVLTGLRAFEKRLQGRVARLAHRRDELARLARLTRLSPVQLADLGRFSLDVQRTRRVDPDVVARYGRHWLFDDGTKLPVLCGGTTISISNAGGASNTGAAWTGGVAPTSADDVTATGTSGNLNIPASTTLACRSFVMTGYVGTLTFSATTSVLSVGDASGGTVTFVATMGLTLTGIGTINFVATGAVTRVLTTAGLTMPNLNVNAGTTCTIQFADAVAATGATITLTQGKLDTNSKTVTSSTAVTAAGTKTLTMGSTNWTCTGGGNAWNWSVTSLTVTANTAVLTLNGAGSTFLSGTLNWQGLSLVLSGSGTQTVQGTGTFANLTRTATAARTDELSLVSSFTVTSTLTLSGNSLANALNVRSSVLGTARTVTCNGTVVINYRVDFSDITAAGSASWDLSGASVGGGTNSQTGNAGGNTGITFTVAATSYWVGDGGSWSDVTHWASSSGGAASSGRVPLPQDTSVFDANSVSSADQTVDHDMPRVGTVSWSAVANNPTWSASLITTATFFGSFTGGTLTRSGWSSVTMIFAGRGSHTITTGAIVNAFTSFTLNAPGGTYTQQDAFTVFSTSAFTITTGTWLTNNFNITCGTVGWSGSATRTITLGSSVVSLVATATGNTWNTNTTTGLTFSGASSTIVFASAASNTTRSFLGGGLTFGNLTYTVANSPGALTITGANVFNVGTFGAGRVVTMPAATTSTFTTLVLRSGTFGYLQLFGVTGGSASTPDSAALSLTGDFSIRAKIAPTTWTPAAIQTILVKWNAAASQKSFGLTLNTAGTLGIILSTDGTTTTNNVSSGVSTGFADNSAHWVRVDRVGNTATFYTSDDGVIWTQLGTPQAVTASALFDGTAALTVGVQDDGITQKLNGAVYYAEVRNAASAVVASPDFTALTKPVTSFSDAQSNVWTLNGVTTGLATLGELTLKSSTGASAATIALTNPTEGDWLVVQDITVTGAQALAVDSNNVSGNTGWRFLPTEGPLQQGRRQDGPPFGMSRAAARAGSW